MKISDENLNKEYNANSSNMSENNTDDDANTNSENSTDDDASTNSENSVDNNSSNDSNNNPENSSEKSSTDGTPQKTDVSLSKSASKALLTGITEIGILIAVCAIIVHFLTRSQTLSEYAEDDPTAAYGTTTSSNDNASYRTTDISNCTTSTDVNNKSEENEETDIVETSVSAATATASTTIQYNTVQYDTAQNTMSGETFTYKPGFTSSPISEAIKIRITGISYPDLTSTASTTYKSKVPSYDDLRYLTLKYKNGDDKDCIGEMICNKAIANDLLEIFSELYDNDYRIDKIRLIDDYGGNDDASVTDDNTSCFNFRTVEGKKKLSNHSLGLAVDINPLYNPYITYKKGIPNIKLPCCVPYADRTASYPYKITTDDLAYKLFIQHGFTWGGNWKSCKDYQHFEKKL